MHSRDKAKRHLSGSRCCEVYRRLPHLLYSTIRHALALNPDRPSGRRSGPETVVVAQGGVDRERMRLFINTSERFVTTEVVGILRFC